MSTNDSTSSEAFDPRHNITAKELDRDLIKLHLPPIEWIATEEEYEAMYPPGVCQQMMKQLPVQNKEQPLADGF